MYYESYRKSRNFYIHSSIARYECGLNNWIFNGDVNKVTNKCFIYINNTFLLRVCVIRINQVIQSNYRR